MIAKHDGEKKNFNESTQAFDDGGQTRGFTWLFFPFLDAR